MKSENSKKKSRKKTKNCIYCDGLLKPDDFKETEIGFYKITCHLCNKVSHLRVIYDGKQETIQLKEKKE
jgi:hypothetical protein